MNRKKTRKQQATGEHKASYTILIAEDNEGLARLIEKKLQHAGLPTARASNGAECIAWVIDHPDALLLLDYRLPDMMANQIVETLAEQNGKVPFVIITGHGDEKIAVEMMKLGARDYLIKEEGFLDLLPSVVERVLGELTIEKELTEAQEALKASQEYAQNLVDSSLDMIIAVDMKRRMTQFNKAAQETFGYRAEEVMGKHINMLYADREAGRKIHETILEKGRHVGEIQNKRKDGDVFPSLLSASVLHDAQGDIIGVMGISRDITEQKRAEEGAQKRVEELEKWERITIGRELKMVELKRRIKELDRELTEARERLAL